MTAYSYHTIASPTEGIYREKGSKFLAYAYPVSSEKEIKEKIDILKKEHFDAQHHCYAWMLGADKVNFRCFDDGEPNHTAGDPILGRIRASGLSNVLIVVVRYFGGVKLGVGGLIAAYKAAAEAALTKVHVIEKFVTRRLRLSFGYDATSEIMRLLSEHDVKILQQDFGTTTDMVLSVNLQQREKILSRLELLKALGKAIDWQFES